MKIFTKPLITIFAVTYYRLPFVKLWANNLTEFLDYDLFDYEIVLVDNNSKDGTPEFLQEYFNTKHPKTKIVLNTTNKGFGEAFHQCFDGFTGEYFTHYSADILVSKKWTKDMIDIFDENPKLGMLAPFYIDNGNNPMVNAKKVMFKNRVEMNKRHLFYSGVDFPSNCADGFSMMRMKALRQIDGYFVKRIYGGHDASLSMRFRSKKWGVAYTSRLTVEHLLPTDDMKGYEKWKREQQILLKTVDGGVEGGWNEQKGFYD